jgi:hypothetical protein
MGFAHPVAAADVALSCVLTDEEIVFTPPSSLHTSSMRRQIAETADLAIKQSVLITRLGSPCDRIPGHITSTNVDVSCSFRPEGIGRSAIEIKIDLQQATISETWDMIESDGSKSDFYRHGTCKAGDAALRVADRASPIREPSALIAAQ